MKGGGWLGIARQAFGGKPAGAESAEPIGSPRILVIRRNRMGDMLCTLPLLHAVRRHYPNAHLAVACDSAGEPIARACPAVDRVILLARGGLRPLSQHRNVRRVRGFDWVIAAKGGFDARLASLVRGSGAKLRIGFVTKQRQGARCYTDAVLMPDGPPEHQIETLLRLLAPLGIKKSAPLGGQLRIVVPQEAKAAARALLAAGQFSGPIAWVLMNISSTTRLRFRPADFVELAGRVVGSGEWAVGLVAAPADQRRAAALAAEAGSPRVVALATPGPLELAGLLERAVLLVTPEGGAAHLAAAVGTAAVVLWSEGPFEKWRSRGERHVFVRAAGGSRIRVERVWEAMEPLLNELKK